MSVAIIIGPLVEKDMTEQLGVKGFPLYFSRSTGVLYVT